MRRKAKYGIIAAMIFFAGFIFWLECIGLTSREIKSPDGKFVIKIASVGLNGTKLVQLSTRVGWPLYRKFYEWHVRDGVPAYFEWFPDAVAFIDHFDFGTSIKVLALPSGKELEYLSPRYNEIQEALRWKYSFTDYDEMTSESKTAAIPADYRVYAIPPREGTLNEVPVRFSYYCVLFKLNAAQTVTEATVRKTAEKIVSKDCQNAWINRFTKTARGEEAFYSVAFSCHVPLPKKHEKKS